MKAIIFDCRSRFDCPLLAGPAWTCVFKTEVYYENNDCERIYHEVCDYDLVLLHLGNADSEHFFKNEINECLPKHSKIAVVLFTGGTKDEGEPAWFMEYREGNGRGRCIYLTDICTAKDIDLNGFIEAWNDSRNDPPFQLLKPLLLPQATLAAYLLDRMGILREFENIKNLADAESPGSYASKIDAYFGFDSTRVLRATEFGIMALSLRAKISHSWLDHEVFSVTEDIAVARWKSGTWREIGARWQTLHTLAVDFGVALPDLLSASRLIDHLDVFKGMSQESLDELKQRLDAIQERGGISQSKAEYLARLDRFWQAAQVYFTQAESLNADEATIRSGWTAVRGQAEALKSLFRDGTIPDGIVLP